MADIDDRRRGGGTGIVAVVALVVLALALFFFVFRPGAETPIEEAEPDINVEINPPATDGGSGGESGGSGE